MSNRLQGSLVAIVSPMREDGNLDLAAFDRLIDWHVNSGTSGIVVTGTTGESATLGTEEHCKLVEHCVKTVDGRIPVIAGTGSNNTEEALLFTRSAQEHGANACLLVTPYYTKPSQEGLYQHFSLLAESVDIPQILYNVPGRTACDLSLATVQRLAEHHNIVGIKDATGDLQRGLELINTCGDKLAIYSGEDALSLPLLVGGADGVISVTANIAPAQMAAMCAAALVGNEQAARQIDNKLALLHKNLFLEANPVPVKWAMSKMGLIEAGIRLPLVRLHTDFHAQVLAALEQADIELPRAA
ncbi:MAG: 4-hydroxy-tetrahydrodipicolinate synthase [Gammaproteobacteria bacterium]|nr:4-hydroxy-tetrahydrodipicolinate synthase [Gammaproteobacteria bacterium]